MVGSAIHWCGGKSNKKISNAMVESGQDVKLQQLERFDNAKQREWKGRVVGICVDGLWHVLLYF